MTTRKFNNRKWKIPIIIVSAVIVTILISSLAVLPLAFGGRFISPSFELDYYVGDRMEVVYINGSVVRVRMISFMVSVTNSYFRPVWVHYNGFEIVLLIYNRTVTEPADVVRNKDFLVWGAFWSEPFQWIRTFDMNIIGAPTAYEYYVARKDLSNYTMEIPVAGLGGYYIGDPSIGGQGWYGQNYISGGPVPPDTYYIYCIAFGQVSKPSNLTVISVLWE